MLGYTDEALLPSAPRRPSTNLRWTVGAVLAGAAILGSMTMAVLTARSWSAGTASQLSIQPPGTMQADQAVALHAVLPHKYAVELVTPVQLQLLRGACWLFAMASVLEQQYRQQGVARGYLERDQYLRLSEQHLGSRLTAECKDNPICMTGDDDNAVTGHSTEGGEVEWMYYLQETLGSSAAVPWSTCPWVPTPTDDADCAGVSSDAARALTPLDFRIRRMRTYYDERDIKEALLRGGRLLSLSLALFGQTYELPCTEATRAFLGCDPAGDGCVPCPLEPSFTGVSCCIAQSRFGTSMRGEFTWGRPDVPIVKAGGHAVGIVGYTDSFPTVHAGVGGFVIKNSWWDGVPPDGMTCKDPTAPCAAGRGSHSIAYFLQRHSEIAERAICPNVHSPDSWYPCASLDQCSASGTRRSATAVRKVLTLQCLERSPYVHGLCTRGDRYYLQRLTASGGGLSVGCFIAAADGAQLCTPPLWAEDLALLFGPIEEELVPNDPDQCGFYLLPYAVFRKVVASFGGTWATDLLVEWSDSSYAAAPAHKRSTDKNYSMLSVDTLTQKSSSFDGPFPDL